MDLLFIIVLAIILSGFFSGMEMAFIASNRLRIELDRKQGAFGSKIIRLFTKNPGQYIATMLIGNSFSLVIYGLVFSKLMGPLLSPIIGSDLLILLVNTLISTGLILIIAEFLPKAIFVISPNFFLKFLSVPTFIFYLLFYPISKLTVSVSNFIIRIFFGINATEKKQEDIIFSKVDIDHLVTHSKQAAQQSEPEHRDIRIFQNALDFSNVKLRECMIPRTEIEAVEVNSSVKELKDKFIETRLSRILVYQNTIDNIIGYFELKDIFRNPSKIRSLTRKLSIVPETMTANKLLKIFVEEKKNIALVVDEFGGTSGMVTIEDVVEEIVGDIEDEHDTIDLIEKKVSENEYILSGRLEIDYLKEKYHFNLPESGEYETLAGMVMFHHGSIPSPGDLIRIGTFSIKVLKATSTRLELVNLKVI